MSSIRVSSLPSPASVEPRPSSHFEIYEAYQEILKDEQISTPLAAILALTELIDKSNAGTMFELVKELNDGAQDLKNRSSNSIGLDTGCELFIAFVTLFPHDSASFSQFKTELVRQGRNYATEALTFRMKIAELALGFIEDNSVILTHSYSRVVVQTLLRVHEKKRISVFVTEARPSCLGVKTYEALTAAGIPCAIVLDSAVAYVMDKIDFVLVGSEAVVESGGLINAVGSNQIAIVARAANKPFYALAESYKFHRLFPLSQYDLPSHNSNILSFHQPIHRPSKPITSPSLVTEHLRPVRVSSASLQDPSSISTTMTPEKIFQNNPSVDYTSPDLISLVFSDVGSLTPEGVSQYLVGMFAG